jgi:hypothetical protein
MCEVIPVMIGHRGSRQPQSGELLVQSTIRQTANQTAAGLVHEWGRYRLKPEMSSVKVDPSEQSLEDRPLDDA